MSDVNEEEMKPRAGERVLYWGSGSPQAWRVMIALEEKQIDYRSVCIRFSSGILKNCLFFKQLNPRQRIPIFVDNTNNNAVVYESMAILEYIEKYYTNIPLMPEVPALFAIAQTRLHEAFEILSLIGEVIVYLRRVPVEKQSSTFIANKWTAVQKELDLWENYLQGSIYLVGKDPCVCDFALFTNLAYAVRCGLKLDGVFPNLANFYTTLCTRPSIDKTWPPHWKSTYGQPVLSVCYNI